MLATLMESQLEISSVDKLVREAAQGQINLIREFVTSHPDQVHMISFISNHHFL